MMQLLSSSIVIGFLRLCFIFLLFYYLNRKYVNRSGSNNFLEFLAHHWFRYGSLVIILLFVTVQLSFYNLFNMLVLLTIIVIMDLIGLQNLRRFRAYFRDRVENKMLTLLKKIELRRNMVSWINPNQPPQPVKKGYYILAIVAVLAIITFGSRYFFIQYDMYSLSGVWLTDLEKVKDFDFQIWFRNDGAVSGDFAFTNFYSKLTDVSPEIALQSMALLQSTLIAIILFWVIRTCTSSKNIAPVVASLSFALAYVLTPVNVYFLLQSKPVFLALTLALPTMVYLLKPSLLKFKKQNFYLSMSAVFTAIGLVDLFVLIILMPPFLLLAIFFSKRKSRSYFGLGLLAYVTSIMVLFVAYVLICSAIRTDLQTFIQQNLISVSSYTYIPQMIIPFESLIRYYQLASVVCILILLVYKFVLKDKGINASLAFLIYFNCLIGLSSLSEIALIDKDLMNEALSVFMHIVTGVAVAIIVRLFRRIPERLHVLNPVMVSLVVVGMVYAAVFYQKDEIAKLDKIDTTPKQVLDAYDRISTTFFPFSYAVVNDNSAQAISTNKHFFINYTDFLYEYPKQDSIYFANIKDPDFLKRNPEYALPKTVLLFVFKGKSGMYGPDGDISELLLDEVKALRRKGREVRLFYTNTNVNVYEIVNDPGQSKIVDLIF